MLVNKIKAELKLYPKPIVISKYIETFEDNHCLKFLALKDLSLDELKEFNLPKLLQDEILARLNPEQKPAP